MPGNSLAARLQRRAMVRAAVDPQPGRSVGSGSSWSRRRSARVLSHAQRVGEQTARSSTASSRAPDYAEEQSPTICGPGSPPPPVRQPPSSPAPSSPWHRNTA